ncbi:hypothetical protein E2C01_089441 [Portunus trituberculatus]|uniref:Uncharacterized protein n=1 Tax=Portunus trituberculatus TaxID=210409 RepID=A0A5B7JH76_PORTR|nr:hypothetical protein [Portunus trituberculatus]
MTINRSFSNLLPYNESIIYPLLHFLRLNKQQDGGRDSGSRAARQACALVISKGKDTGMEGEAAVINGASQRDAPPHQPPPGASNFVQKYSINIKPDAEAWWCGRVRHRRHSQGHTRTGAYCLEGVSVTSQGTAHYATWGAEPVQVQGTRASRPFYSRRNIEEK